ncbi:MAG: DUF2391 family protein [Nanoarchaeota archaeon]
MRKKRSRSNFKNLMKEEKTIEQLEKAQLKKLAQEDAKLNRLEKEEQSIERLTKREIQDINDLKKIEDQIKRSVTKHPLKKITTRDMARGLIGSFFGIVAHFAFIEGADAAERFNITIFRATLLLITAFLIGTIFLYATGYRKIKDAKLVSILPIRIFVMFGISILSIVSVLALFGIINSHSSFSLVYRQIAVISIPSIIGAITADLIGDKNE